MRTWKRLAERNCSGGPYLESPRLVYGKIIFSQILEIAVKVCPVHQLLCLQKALPPGPAVGRVLAHSPLRGLLWGPNLWETKPESGIVA